MLSLNSSLRRIFSKYSGFWDITILIMYECRGISTSASFYWRFFVLKCGNWITWLANKKQDILFLILILGVTRHTVTLINCHMTSSKKVSHNITYKHVQVHRCNTLRTYEVTANVTKNIVTMGSVFHKMSPGYIYIIYTIYIYIYIYYIIYIYIYIYIIYIYIIYIYICIYIYMYILYMYIYIYIYNIYI